jgi:hypothetical protein
MDRIRQLLQSFSKSEVKALKTYLSAFHTKGENKQLELINLIEKSPEITQESAARKLYDDPKSKAFIMMKARLYEKMLELISLSVFTEGKRNDGEVLLKSNPVEIRKLLLAGQELVRRKQFNLATDQFEEAYEYAKKHSFHELELEALLRMTVFRGLMDKKSALDETGGHHGEIQNVMKKLDVYIKAVCTKELFSAKYSLAAGSDDEKIKFLEFAIPSIENDLAGIESAQTEYILNGLKIQYLSTTDKIDECRAVINRQVEVIPMLGIEDVNRRYPNLYFQLGILELKAHDYKASFAAFRKIEEVHSSKLGHAYFKARIFSLYPLIYLKDMDTLSDWIAELEGLKDLPVNRNNIKTLSLLRYFVVVFEYLQGHVKKAWQLTQEIEELDFDKVGWIAGLRTLEIMFLIELDELDLASARIETLRKHVSRYPGDRRVETMQKLLSGQERIGFSFKSFKAESHLLRALETELKWIHFGHEMIRFDVWYHEQKKRKGIIS